MASSPPESAGFTLANESLDSIDNSDISMQYVSFQFMFTAHLSPKHETVQLLC